MRLPCPEDYRDGEAGAKYSGFQHFDRNPAAGYSCRLMSVELDRLLEPRALAARAWQLRAGTPLRDWPRLAALDPAGAEAGKMVDVDVAFREHHSGWPVLEGEVSVALAEVCQRCLEPMQLVLRARPALVFGAGDEASAAAAAEGFEACEFEPGTTLGQLLEDELLLSIPVSPVHERSLDCGTLAGKLAELEPARDEDKRTSPFAALAQLKRKN
jgi:uncharacterized protein